MSIRKWLLFGFGPGYISAQDIVWLLLRKWENATHNKAEARADFIWACGLVANGLTAEEQEGLEDL